MVKALLVAVTLATALPAHAADDSAHVGGCIFDTVAHPDRPDVQVGTIRSEVVVYSPGTDNPVSATVTCTIRVNGEPVRSASFSGTTVVVGAEYTEYEVRWDQYPSFCEVVDFTSDDTPTDSICYEVDAMQIPPQEVYDLLEKIPS